jgi:hypothetical protein
LRLPSWDVCCDPPIYPKLLPPRRPPFPSLGTMSASPLPPLSWSSTLPIRSVVSTRLVPAFGDRR